MQVKPSGLKKVAPFTVELFLVFCPESGYLSLVTRVTLFVLLILGCRLQSQVLSFDPERLVTLELANGTILSGRIIDADAQQLHLVGAQVNQLIPFALLGESSRKGLGLLSHKPSENAPIAEFHGLNSTRTLLKESQADLASSGQRPLSRFSSYPPYSGLFRCYQASPCHFRNRLCFFSGGLFLQF